ncbi:MAG: CAP domain-containing protein [Actinomycetota bacterium]
MGRRLSVTLAATAAAALLLASSPSSATTSQEADFVNRINAERSSRGLSSLTVKNDLTAVARDWAQHMAAAGSISHDPNLANKVSGWTVLGDNVGKGPSVSTIHEAFMKSDTHRHIILDTDFNQIGVGVAKSGTVIYVTQIFARRSSGGSGGSSTPAPSKPKIGTAIKHVAPAPATEIITLTGRIWAIDLTAPPVTVDKLLQLIQLDH